LPLRGEPTDVADGGEERRRDDHVDARDCHQPFGLGPAEHLEGDHALDLGDLCVEKLDLAQPGVDRLALLDGKLELAQPAPALDAEEVRERRLPFQPPHEHRLDLVLRTRARTHELRAPRQPPAQCARALVGHPDRVE
jgi:hypothetical protein